MLQVVRDFLLAVLFMSITGIGMFKLIRKGPNILEYVAIFFAFVLNACFIFIFVHTFIRWRRLK